MTATDRGMAPAAERPALRRTRDDRMIFGVCGGIGRYLGIDPVLVRIAFVLLAVFGGSGVLLYLIGLVAIPEDAPGGTVAAGSAAGMTKGPAVVIGVVLVAVGTLMLAGRVIPALGDLFGPLILICLGALVIVGGRR